MSGVEPIASDTVQGSEGFFDSNIKYLQSTLTLGYLILLTIGFLTDSIIYGSLGIDILHYSSVFDLLVSPLATLLADIRKMVIISVFIIGFPVVITFFKKRYQGKTWYTKYFKEADEIRTKKLGDFLSLVFISALFSCGLFTGLAMTAAENLKEEITTQTYDLTHAVEFRDGSKEEVMMIGQNTQYIFYVPKGTSAVTVSPILTNIKKIVQL